jgi:hypothetical protein
MEQDIDKEISDLKNKIQDLKKGYDKTIKKFAESK